MDSVEAVPIELTFAHKVEPGGILRVRTQSADADALALRAWDAMTAEPNRRNQRQPAKTPDRESMKKSEDTAFDRWLNRQLHRVYDSVLDEPVPTDIEQLLDGFDAKEAKDE